MRAPSVFRPGDLRGWLDEIDDIGSLKRVSGAHWNLEIGAIAEANNQRDNPPALLFDAIPDYSTGRVVACATSGVSTLAATLRLQAANSRSLVQQLGAGQISRWFESARNMPFEWVDDGPVSANRDAGNDVDLYRFPTPLWHAHDGGRYIGTGPVMITRDPETGTYNAGTYRSMITDRNHVTVNMAAPSRHGMQHKLKYEARGERCPIVISIGHDPLLALIGGIEVPEGLFEIDVVSAIAGTPTRMIRGPITGLPIPADAEIVLEGWFTGERAPEGPFGDYLGYYTQPPDGAAPNVVVEAVYYRDDPIMLGVMPSKPPHDFSYSWSVMRSALIEDQVKAAGIPGVAGVWADEAGGARSLIVIAIKQRYFGHSRQAGFIASQCQAGAYYGRYVIVVDDDIDPSNIKDVMWAVATRSDPGSDIEIIHKAWGAQGDPLRFTYPAGTLFGTRGIIDACRSFEQLDTFHKVAACTPEERDVILRKWQAVFE